MPNTKSCFTCGCPIEFKLYGKNTCRDCHAAKGRRWRATNLARAHELDKLKRIRHKEKYYQDWWSKADYINSFKARPCMDCGGEFPDYVMQFDHVRGQKHRIVSGMKQYSKERIDAEIAKCDIVCANCHAIRTEKRRLAAILK